MYDSTSRFASFAEITLVDYSTSFLPKTLGLLITRSAPLFPRYHLYTIATKMVVAVLTLQTKKQSRVHFFIPRRPLSPCFCLESVQYINNVLLLVRSVCDLLPQTRQGCCLANMVYTILGETRFRFI